MHQDAHEFLNYLLNRVMEDMEEDGRRHGSAGNGTKSVEDCECVPDECFPILTIM